MDEPIIFFFFSFCFWDANIVPLDTIQMSNYLLFVVYKQTNPTRMYCSFGLSIDCLGTITPTRFHSYY